jgi:hypothetical protein
MHHHLSPSDAKAIPPSSFADWVGAFGVRAQSGRSTQKPAAVGGVILVSATCPWGVSVLAACNAIH